MLYLQSFIRSPDRAPSMRPFKLQTLSDKTNAPSFRPRAKFDSTKKGLGLRGSGSGNKAAPTVALTPASTSAPDAVPQSFVPFPSSDEDSEGEAEEEYDVKAPSASTSSASYSENGLKRPLPAEGRRKRCQVPPADSSHGAAPRRRSTAALMRPASTASSASASPSPKRPKKSRRAVADMQFAADVHRSILRSMSARDDAAAVTMAVDGPADVLREQDRALADRLSKSLRELGCSPALIEGCAHTASPSVEVTKTQFEGGAGTGVEVGVEVGSVPREDDVVMHAVDAAGRAPDAPLAPPPHGSCTPASSSTSSSTSTSPPPSPQSPVRTRSPSPPASTATPVPGARVYEMPQLVAALYIRRHDRAAKTRATPPAERVRVRMSSPLALSVAVTAASD